MDRDRITDLRSATFADTMLSLLSRSALAPTTSPRGAIIRASAAVAEPDSARWLGVSAQVLLDTSLTESTEEKVAVLLEAGCRASGYRSAPVGRQSPKESVVESWVERVCGQISNLFKPLLHTILCERHRIFLRYLCRD